MSENCWSFSMKWEKDKLTIHPSLPGFTTVCGLQLLSQANF